VEKEKKHIEYIHEEIHEANSNNKWTIFNKHAIEIDDRSPQGTIAPEDQIIDEMKLRDKYQNECVCSVPEKTWIALYEAKCMDLGIPCKSDKHQERFVTQMLLGQRRDRISLKDQGLGFESARVISQMIIAGNDDLTKIDLSNNQLQQNFGALMKGFMLNERLVVLTMRNNQINGHEHASELKNIVKNHQSLTVIDFSNTEMCINKNKLKNAGARAIVEGILETQDQSIISDINLSYNFLTHDCLHHFAKLKDPNFIQLQCLNLSYNDLGPDSIKILGPILGTVIELNLARTKLNN
jgi:hypothetical protein